MAKEGELDKKIVKRLKKRGYSEEDIQRERDLVAEAIPEELPKIRIGARGILTITTSGRRRTR